MTRSDRIIAVLLLVGAALTAWYWWSYFTGGDVMVLRARWYTAFESSFPVADGWMALCWPNVYSIVWPTALLTCMAKNDLRRIPTTKTGVDRQTKLAKVAV